MMRYLNFHKTEYLDAFFDVLAYTNLSFFPNYYTTFYKDNIDFDIREYSDLPKNFSVNAGSPLSFMATLI